MRLHAFNLGIQHEMECINCTKTILGQNTCVRQTDPFFHEIRRAYKLKMLQLPDVNLQR